MQDPNDEELIEKSKGGDTVSYKTLVARKEGKVAAVVNAMLGEQRLAEDIGQEIFVRLYDSLDKIQGDFSVDTFVLRLAAEYSLDELKRRKKSAHFDAAKSSKKNSTQSLKDVNEQFELAFSSLDPQEKLIATLRLVGGYTTGEIAELLKLPINTVLAQLAMAQHTLRVALSNELE